MRSLALTAGALSLAAQTVLLREALVAVEGSELIVGVFLASWLVWVAVGARLSAWLPPQPRAVALAYYPAIAAQLLGVHALRALAGVGPAEVLPLVTASGWLLVLSAPVSLVTGGLFPLLARDRDASATYAWEALGSFVGGAALTGIVLLGLSPLVALGAAGVALALAVAADELDATAWTAVGWAGASAGVLLGAASLTHALEASSLARLLPDAELVATGDTPSGRTTVARRGEQIVVLRDGHVLADHPHDARLDAALALAQAHPREVLLLGEGVEDLAAALLEWESVERVHLVVPDARAHQLIQPHLPADLRQRLLDGRVRTHWGDPRALDLPAVDLVVVSAGDPTTARDARHTTADALRDLPLSPHGVVALYVRAGENALGSELEAYGASALATVASVFPHVAVLPGDPARVYASRAPVVTEDPDELVARARALGGPLDPRAVASAADLARSAFVRERWSRAEATPSTDANPRSFALALQVQERLAGSGGRLLAAAGAAGPALWVVPLLVFLAGRGLRTWRAPRQEADGRRLSEVVLGGASLTGLALGVVLLYALQLRAGTLYGDVGLAHAVLLAGVAGGAAGGRALVGRLDPPGSRRPQRVPRSTLVALGLLAVGVLALPALAEAAPHGPRALPVLLGALALAGAVTGLAFPAAAALRTDRRPAASLWSVDHLGGAVGALVAGVLLLPHLGTGGTRWALLSLVVGLVGLVLLRAWRSRVLGDLVRRDRWAPGPVAGAVVALVVLGAWVAPRLHPLQVRMDPLELSSLGDGPWEPAERPFVHYRSPTRSAARSAAVARVDGFGGPLSVRVVLEGDGTLGSVQLMDHHETPSYLGELGPWLAGLAGRPLPLDVEALSGATVTSRAVAKAADTTGRALSREVLGRPVPAGAPPGSPVSAALVWVVLSLAVGLASVWAGPRTRRFLLAGQVAGAVLFGVQLSLAQLAGPLRGHLPGDPATLALVGGVAALTLALGPVYCGQICPVGALQELLGSLGLTRSVPEAWDRRLRRARPVLLVALVVAFALTGEGLAADPLTRLWRGGAWVAGGLILAGSLVVHRGWCRYLCPTGALLALGNRTLLGRRLLPPRRLSRCDYGVRAGDGDCLQCGRCTADPPPDVGPRSTRPSLHPALLVAGVVLVAGLVLWEIRPAPPARPGGARPADVDALELLIDAGRLSDREAEFWEPAE